MDTKARVRFRGALSEEFEIETGRWTISDVQQYSTKLSDNREQQTMRQGYQRHM